MCFERNFVSFFFEFEHTGSILRKFFPAEKFGLTTLDEDTERDIKQMKKKLFSLLLAAAIICSMVPTAFAASNEETAAAETLYDLGLFNGTGNDVNGNPIFALDRTPTRHESVTMLVRLLGKSTEAHALTWRTPFTDVADWAKPYVGYAYANKLTSGTSPTTYSGESPTTATQYLSFVLTALGYEKGTDFQWDRAWELSDAIGLTDGRYNQNNTKFTRGDVAIISLNALSTKLNNSNTTLIEELVKGNVVSVSAAMNAGLIGSSDYTYTKTPATATHAMIQKDGTINKAVITINRISPTITPKYDILDRFQGYEVELVVTFTFDYSNFYPNNRFTSLYLAAYDESGNMITRNEYRVESLDIGKTYTYKLKLREPVPEGKISILFQDQIYDARTGEWAQYAIY